MTVPNSAGKKKKIGILVIDDDRVSLIAISEVLKKLDYSVLAFEDGQTALEKLEKAPHEVETIILDRDMPGISGLEFMSRVKANHKTAHIPVVMLTAAGNSEDIQQGIEAGVFYYLVKPVSEEMLKAIINSALREHQQRRALVGELSKFDGALKAIDACQLSIKTLSEAEDAACFLATCFPQPERVVSGLMELLVNAVEHGNLAITYEEKTKLIEENRWRDEIKHRLTLPENIDKSVTTIYQKKKEGWYVQITDKGKGFDWRRYWRVDPNRATAAHGRGIARARLMAFDQLSYNDAGNQVTVMVSPQSSKPLEW